MQQLAAWPDAPRLAVACSGGSDSMALALLAQNWALKRGGTLYALIIDHGLRSTSAQEAAQTATWLRARGIQAVILPLDLPAQNSALQERAREARYGALTGWCLAQEVPTLLTAHHAEDQLETFLFRLLRGSGIHGLAGMSACRMQDGIRILRPVLRSSKADLQAYLRALQQPWIEDPSNQNTRFERVRIRQFLEAHVSDQQQQRISALIDACGRMRAQDEAALLSTLDTVCEVYPFGVIRAAQSLLNAPKEQACFRLKHLLTRCNGTPYPPRQHEVEQLYTDLLNAPDRARSLHHCLIVPHARSRSLLFCREPARAAPAQKLLPAQRLVWDKRFTITTPECWPPHCHIAPLGKAGVAALKARAAALPEAMPVRALLAVPAIWQLEALHFVPHIYEEKARKGFIAPEITFHAAKALADTPFYIMNEAS